VSDAWSAFADRDTPPFVDIVQNCIVFVCISLFVFVCEADAWSTFADRGTSLVLRLFGILFSACAARC
jgi:hypothetical protein